MRYQSGSASKRITAFLLCLSVFSFCAWSGNVGTASGPVPKLPKALSGEEEQLLDNIVKSDPPPSTEKATPAEGPTPLVDGLQKVLPLKPASLEDDLPPLIRTKVDLSRR